MSETDWNLLQTPGPTNIPEDIRAALARPGVNHRSQEFADVTIRVVAALKQIAATSDASVVLYPSSGTGAWEAALTNAVPRGGTLLFAETGIFSSRWRDMAIQLGYRVVDVEGDWSSGANVEGIHDRLKEDSEQRIDAVAIVHSETSTGVLSDIAEIRQALNDSGHRALLLVDAISSFGCVEYLHDEWAADVTITASQKALMLPPGIGINIISPKAAEAALSNHNPRSYWDWGPIVEHLEQGQFRYTPPTHLILGLDVASHRILDEGLPAVYARHSWMAEAVRGAVHAWGLQTQVAPGAIASPALTGVVTPTGFDVGGALETIRTLFGVTLGAGLGPTLTNSFRIGHLGALTPAMLLAVVGATEAGLTISGLDLDQSGLAHVMSSIVQRSSSQGDLQGIQLGKKQ